MALLAFVFLGCVFAGAGATLFVGTWLQGTSDPSGDSAPSIAEPTPATPETEALLVKPKTTPSPPPASALTGALSPGDEANAKPSQIQTQTLAERAAIPSSPQPRTTKGSRGLPKWPSSDSVNEALSRAASFVKLCGDGKATRIAMQIDFLGATGKVFSAVALDDNQGTAVARCAEIAVRSMEVPRFSENNLTLRRVFVL